MVLVDLNSCAYLLLQLYFFCELVFDFRILDTCRIRKADKSAEVGVNVLIKQKDISRSRTKCQHEKTHGK